MRIYCVIKFFLTIPLLVLSCRSSEQTDSASGHKHFSGVYPHLAYYNNEGECGTGAVVPWADRLWVVTYGPHLPMGSSDRLYEITPDLQIVNRQESVGGTPANRMIHRESSQLFIGPYAIDKERRVRTIPYSQAPGRYTGLARHLTNPDSMIYIATMEEGFYEVDVNTLKTHMLYEDANIKQEKGDDISTNQPGSLLPGAHGKGVYSGQGVMVYSNNGEAVKEALKQFDIQSGVLAEWDGADWKVVRRNQFVEVTGPGGIYGNDDPATDPIWATGWDHKSVILGVRHGGKWSFYRLPKASHSYDGAHGWNTEWPRIRDVGTEDQSDYLMTMHGMFWRFPGNFDPDNAVGIRPRSSYLKVIGDFTRWNGQLVFGCDDSAQKEFLNKRRVKGNIEGPGQSNSNLWFTSFELPDQLGPTTAAGAVWLKEAVNAGATSEPFLFAGWPKRVAWIANDGEGQADFLFEADIKGDGTWSPLKTVSVAGRGSQLVRFDARDAGEWIRVRINKSTTATVHFYFGDEDQRGVKPYALFDGLAQSEETKVMGGLVYGLDNNRRALGMLALDFDGGSASEVGYYELNAEMKLERKEDPQTSAFIREKFAVPVNVVKVDQSSVIIDDDQGRRWRLPLGDPRFTNLTDAGALRIDREVATERDLFNCHGTFYELPAENADGFAKIRPVASHNFRIHDYASYRGMLIMTGVDPASSAQNSHIVRSDDGKAAVWAGVIDDLWKLGKPTGRGGPWKDAAVNPGQPSDPYLIGFYDDRKLTLSHDLNEPVTFTVEVEPIGHGPWMKYEEITVAPGETVEHVFGDDFQARWIRFTSNRKATATAWLEYQ